MHCTSVHRPAPVLKASQRSSRRSKLSFCKSVVVTHAVASDVDANASASNTKWYACVANAKFMLNDVQNESFAEQLREKTRYYREKDKPLDFFLVCDPEWLEKQHPSEAKKVQRPCIALVGAEESWLRYMKLRLDRVLFLEVEGTQAEITKSGSPVPNFDRLDGDGKKWTAPYSPYAPGWWEVFMPGIKK